MASPNKVPQVIMTMSDNRNWSNGNRIRKYLYLLNYDRSDNNSNGNCVVFGHAQSKKLTPSNFDKERQPKWQYRRFASEAAISGSRSLSKSVGYTFIELVIIENSKFVVGISMLSVIIPEI